MDLHRPLLGGDMVDVIPKSDDNCRHYEILKDTGYHGSEWFLHTTYRESCGTSTDIPARPAQHRIGHAVSTTAQCEASHVGGSFS